MRALLDTNVVLDALLTRAPWHVDADAILWRLKPGLIDLAISALTEREPVLVPQPVAT